MRHTLLLIALLTASLHAQTPLQTHFQSARPFTRLWWFADTTSEELIVKNLDYLKEKGFGGVECAFIYPYNRKDTAYAARHEWLSPAFVEKVRFAKNYAAKIGLGCDITFGTLWPFGDDAVPRSEATVCLLDSTHTDSMKYLWSHPRPGLVIDHLSKTALRHYAQRLTNAFGPVLRDNSNLTMMFVDSWEVTAQYLGTPGFEEAFFKRFGYHIRPYIKDLYLKNGPYPQVLYDYRKLVSDMVIDNFYREFTQIAHEAGSCTRGQAAGAPCDIIRAYAALDVPESEALLYEPHFAAIPAAAAAFSGKKVVSSETFTCLYGFPSDHFKKEQTADLKLLADMVFANGVNQVIWHGKPLARTEKDVFYATVHIGPSGALDEELPAFNQYMTKVSEAMQAGSSYAKVAVYLPTEDAWIKGVLPVKEQKIWSWGYYEMRENKFPKALLPWRPMWINQSFLSSGTLENGILRVGDMRFSALYVDAQYLDIASLESMVRLAEKGFPVVMKRRPEEPGLMKQPNGAYAALLQRLYQCKNVTKHWKTVAKTLEPVVAGKNLPDYWCRETPDGLSIFFANPKSAAVKFPMGYGQSYAEKDLVRPVKIHYNGREATVDLVFKPYQSVLLKMNKSGVVQFENITFVPKTPQIQARAKKKLERWEVDPKKKQMVCHE